MVGYSPAQKLIYLPLKWGPPLRQPDLARALSHPQRTVRYALQELEADGIVVTVPSTADVRSGFYTVLDEDPPPFVPQPPNSLPRYFPGELGDLSPASKIVYLALVSEGPITRYQVAWVLRHNESTVRKALEHLEAEGFIMAGSANQEQALYYDLAPDTPYPHPPRNR